MSDISKVEVQEYEGGYAIVPESEMKEVFIPSPPTMSKVAINPRPAFIYLSSQAITPDSEKIDAMKAYAVDNKVVILCPEETSGDDVVETYEYATINAKKLNIKKDEIFVKAEPDMMAAAEEAVEALEDEDVEVEEAEELVF